MKLRNGFVSNSSSASFILAFPKDNPIELKNIEEWFGGFSEVLNPIYRDIFGFVLWKSQYFDDEMCSRDLTNTGEEYDHYICASPVNIYKDLEYWNCPVYIGEISTKLNEACKTCKYLQVEKRFNRNDDYYYVKNFISDEISNWLEEHKEDKIIYLNVDDNSPEPVMPFDLACEITSHAYELFSDKSRNVLVCDGK